VRRITQRLAPSLFPLFLAPRTALESDPPPFSPAASLQRILVHIAETTVISPFGAFVACSTSRHVDPKCSRDLYADHKSGRVPLLSRTFPAPKDPSLGEQHSNLFFSRLTPASQGFAAVATVFNNQFSPLTRLLGLARVNNHTFGLFFFFHTPTASRILAQLELFGPPLPAKTK